MKEHDMTTTERRASYIAGLRALADLLETHDVLPLPTSELAWPMFVEDNPKMMLAVLARAVPNSTKHYEDDYFKLRFALHGLQIRAWAMRDQVCERVVTGTREVQQQEVVTPAETKTVTVTEEIVEWVCAPLLAAVSA